MAVDRRAKRPGTGRGSGWQVPEVRAQTLASRRRPLAVRFAKFVDPAGEDECWPWKGGGTAQGYGLIRIDKVQRLATHVALELAGKPRPGDLLACHKCDNPPCVNPKHLYWGTHSDNAADFVSRGSRRHPK